MSPLLLGIDLGTSATKALVVDADTSQVIGSGEGPCAVASPAPGWSEQDPAWWWSAAVTAIRGALDAASATTGASPTTVASRVAGIGLAGQMHGLVALDEGCRVIRPCILWNDQRSAAQCADLERSLGIAGLVRLTGNRVYAGFTLPKLLWMRQHEPQAFHAVRHVLLPKDWLRWRLTGELGQDVTDASGTAMFDPATRRWSGQMLHAVEVPDTWLPPVHESAAVVGGVTAEAAAVTGLRAGTPVVAGAGDQAAAAIGMGIVADGACSATIGTSGVVFVARDRHAPDAQGRLHAFCHADPGRWHQMGVVLSAGGALRWFRDVLAVDAIDEARRAGVDPYEIIARRASEAPPGCEGLTFLPYLAGERTPHADPFAQAALLGLTLRHDRRHVARAVLEGITFALRDCLDLIRATGAAPDVIRLAGGGARSAFWRQLCADVFGCAVAVLPSQEGGAMGAALLAGVGSGAHPDVQAACRTLPSPSWCATPAASGSARDALEDALVRFRARYGAVRGQPAGG